MSAGPGPFERSDTDGRARLHVSSKLQGGHDVVPVACDPCCTGRHSLLRRDRSRFDVRGGRERSAIRQLAHVDHDNSVWSLAFSGGTHLAWSTTSKIRLNNLANGEIVELGDSPGSFGPYPAFSPDGKFLAVGGKETEVRLWDTATGRELEPLTLGTTAVKTFAISPDGTTLAVATAHSSVATLWDWPRRRPLAALDGHAGTINLLAFAPDGRTLLTADSVGEVQLWDVASRRVRGTAPRARLGHHGDGLLARWQVVRDSELHGFRCPTVGCRRRRAAGIVAEHLHRGDRTGLFARWDDAGNVAAKRRRVAVGVGITSGASGQYACRPGRSRRSLSGATVEYSRLPVLTALFASGTSTTSSRHGLTSLEGEEVDYTNYRHDHRTDRPSAYFDCHVPDGHRTFSVGRIANLSYNELAP